MVEYKHISHRRVQGHYMTDTNAINARGKDEYLNRLRRWHNAGVIDLIMPNTVREELQGYSLGAKTADSFIYETQSSSSNDLPADIVKVLYPSGFSNSDSRKNQENDVRIVASARKYGRTLITSDGGILGHSVELRHLGVRVISPKGAVEAVEHMIAERDRIEREMAQLQGSNLPEWVGKD